MSVVQGQEETTPELVLPELSDEQRAGIVQSYKFNPKINGEEKEYSYEDMIRDVQKGESADSKFREANEIRTKYEGLMQNLDNLSQTEDGKKQTCRTDRLQNEREGINIVN